MFGLSSRIAPEGHEQTPFISASTSILLFDENADEWTVTADSVVEGPAVLFGQYSHPLVKPRRA
jgi:hypothetical protein